MYTTQYRWVYTAFGWQYVPQTVYIAPFYSLAPGQIRTVYPYSYVTVIR
jgi:hypothetical protein